jgi:hypothetical protein
VANVERFKKSMRATPPPIQQQDFDRGRPANLGRWGVSLALVAPVVVLLMVLIQPG